MHINQDGHVTQARFRRLRFKWALFFLLFFVFLIFFRSHKDEGDEEKQERVTEEEINVEDIDKLRDSPDIRVLIQSGNYEGIYHKSVKMMFPDGGYLLYYRNHGWTKHTIAAGETVVIAQSGGDYNLSKDEIAVLLPAETDGVTVIESIVRSRSTCDYSGRIEISVSGDGLTVVNVLPLETYLKLVVPSEMPASFDREALKAQAILARTYAYHYLLSPAYEEQNAHLDDSISSQVYGNLDANDTTDEAVESTEGVLLFSGNNLAEVYYYSTSWGFGTDGTAWGGDGQTYLQALRIGPDHLYNSLWNLTGEEAEQYLIQYLKSESVFRSMMDEPFVPAYESELPWYRWVAVNEAVDVMEMEKRLKERYVSDPSSVLTQNKDGSFSTDNIKSIGTLQNIEVYERGEGGIVLSLLITGSKNTYLVNREYNIRYVLCSSDVQITKQDGATVGGNTLLPSGFFYILTTKTGQNGLSYTIYGGGYGHGVGMSQNGADQMARTGLKAEEILSFYFPDTRLVKYEEADS